MKVLKVKKIKKADAGAYIATLSEAKSILAEVVKVLSKAEDKMIRAEKEAAEESHEGYKTKAKNGRSLIREAIASLSKI